MHKLAEWKHRDDALIGASIFLTAEGIKEARKEGSVEIKITNK